MSAPAVGPLVNAGLRIFEALLPRMKRDPATRAGISAARAKLLADTADAAEVDARHHELSSLTGDKQSQGFHLPRARRLFRKRDRLRRRSLWWSMRAKKWEHSIK